MANDGVLYELGYLLSPAIPQDKVLDTVAEIRNVIENAAGVILSEEQPRMRQLAYKMAKTIANRKQHFNEAYLGYIRFNGTPIRAKEIEEKLRKNDLVIRFLLIRAEAVEHLAPGRTLKPRGAKPIDGPKQEISHEEIDRELENLIGEEPKVAEEVKA